MTPLFIATDESKSREAAIALIKAGMNFIHQKPFPQRYLNIVKESVEEFIILIIKMANEKIPKV